MWPRIRLRQVLFITSTIIASLPVLILAVWVQQSALDKEIAAVKEKHLLVARNLTGDLNRYIIDVESGFRLAARNLLQGNEIAGVPEHLDSLYLRYICVVDEWGIVKKQLTATSKSKTNNFKETVLAVLQPLMAHARSEPGKILYSDLIRTGEHETTFYLLEYVSEGQYVVGALSTNHIIEVQKQISFGRRGHAAIVDRTGRAIAHPIAEWVQSMKDMSFLPPVQQMKLGKTGVAQFFTPAMQADMVAGYTTVPRVGWGVMIPQPMEELEERANDVQLIALAIALIGLAIAGLISWYIAGVLSKPIQSVVDATQLEADENQNPMVAEVSTAYRFIPHELRELLNSFNLMRRKLNDITSKLHSKINYANEEVRSQNEKLQNYSNQLLEANEKLEIEIDERRKAQEESALQSSRLRALYNATQLQDLGYDENILSVLRLGCKFFDMSIGRVCEIDAVKNTNTIRYVIAPDEYDIRPGKVNNLDDTFCKIPFETEQTIDIDNVQASDWQGRPCHRYSQLEAYLATVIWVSGKKYGTINFSSPEPRKTPFTESDIDFIRIMAQWVGISMERRISVEKDNARSAAEAANQAKGTFLANMSHELRTPINAILGYGEILMEDCEAAGNEEMRRDLEKIQIAGTHLTKLISNILDLSKIEAGKVDIHNEDINIAILVNDVVATTRPLFASNKNQISTHLDADIGSMYSDPTIVQQILLNLLSNAAKFSHHSTVHLYVQKTIINGVEYAQFTVEDNGIGMSEEQLQIVFDEFSQANSTTSAKFGGIGLGLSISKKYAALLNGTISATSKLGKGSSFCVTLPTQSSNVLSVDGKYSVS